MPITRYLTDREKKLAKLLGDISNMEPEAWARVQKSFDANYDRNMKSEHYNQRP